VGVLATPALTFVNPSQRVYFFYLFTAVLMAALVEIWREGREWSLGKVGAALFPKRILTSRDLKNDVIWVLCGGLLLYGGFASFKAVSNGVREFGLAMMYGALPSPQVSVNFMTTALCTLALAMAADFAVYWAHRLQHEVSALWTFHQVHHSAVELNPLTVYRMHPVDLVGNGLLAALVLGASGAVLSWVFDAAPRETTVNGVNVLVFFFYMLGYNLRHTHYWVSFGPLDRILVSPAMHQIHHSLDEKHWDKNMGLVFSIWDQMFGTAYIPKERETLKFGIGEAGERFQTAWDFLVEPFRQMVRKG
jgi:sterol desaturase/sphingolipid hydroxylase (fatty acid hydroxylase superfamily)